SIHNGSVNVFPGDNSTVTCPAFPLARCRTLKV
ncbi:MAG: hypothetical protein ACI845_000634, partial [Gammaproteobacteria bacterium]